MRRAFRTALPALFPILAIGCSTAPTAGNRAPDFAAVLQDGKTATLSSLMGEKGVVLYFYPKDETPGCTTQACTFQEQLAGFEKAGYKVVGVSVDTGESHQAFRSKHNISFNLIADTTGALASLYAVPVEKDPFGTEGFRRTTFVIGKDGGIIQRFEVANPEEQVRRAYKTVLGEPF